MLILVGTAAFFFRLSQTLKLLQIRRTSDGYALAVGWSLGWSIWSVYGRLGSWSVVGSLSSGYGVEGEKSDSFEDHFMQGVRDLVSYNMLDFLSTARLIDFLD